MSHDDNDDHDLAKFVFDLRKEDVLGTVMRAQMHIQQELNRFIQRAAASPKHVKFDELDFKDTVRLAAILGLNAELKPALAALGALRNKFGRELGMKFEEQEANNFYNALGPELKGLIREVYTDRRTEKNLAEFKRQSPHDRLVWFLIGIWSAVFADRKQEPAAHRTIVKLPSGYLEGVKERQSAFFPLLEGHDDLGMVIRAHIYLEHELREFVLAAAPQPNEIKPSEYDYAGTLGLALTLGLDPTLEKGLATVGTLRNKFAHRLDMKLTEHEAKQIYSALDSSTQADAQAAWSAAYRLHPESGRPQDLLGAKPVDLVAACMTMLWGGVVLGHVQLRIPGRNRD